MRYGMLSFISKRVFWSLLVCFIIIAAVDVVLPGRDFWPDETHYESEAKSLVETGTLVARDKWRAFGMPGAGIIYSLPYMLTNDREAFYRAARVINALLHIMTAVGAASIAWSIFKKKLTALIVLYSMIIYPSLLAYQATILCETTFIFFLIWGFAFLFAWDGTPGREKYFYAAAATFVLSLYVKATITSVMPFLMLSRALFVKRSWRERARAFVLSCAIFAVMMTPWWVRNYTVFGEFVPFTTSASWNLYLGNNPGNTTAGIGGGPNGDVERETVERIQALGDELAISRAYTEEAKRYILENKATFVRNAWLKFKRFWNFQSNFEGDSYSMAFVLYNVMLALSWGVACPLALVSFWLNRARWRDFLPIFTIIAYFTLIHVVVIASLRYRLPIEPLFVIVGADSVTRAIERIGRGRAS